MGKYLDIDDVVGGHPEAERQLAVMREAFAEIERDNKHMREVLNLARVALADIAYSSDMNLTLARKKAKRIYRETETK